MKRIIRFNKSLLGTFIRYILIYTLASLALIFLNDYVSYRRTSKYFNDLENIMDYTEYLISDDYDKIPSKSYASCSFIVYDENYHVVYRSDNDFFNDFDPEVSSIIVDYTANARYELYYLDDDTRPYLVTLVKNNDSSNELIDYAILDSSLTVIQGNLFKDKGGLTEEEFKVIDKSYFVGYLLEKCEYLNKNNERRILVFASNDFSESRYIEALNQNSWDIYLLCLIIVALMIVLSYLLKRSLVRRIKPLDEAIISYRKTGKYEYEKEKIIPDYEHVMDSFAQMTKEIEVAKADKERIIADISHDLKTPLTTIMGYSKAITSNIVADDKKYYYLTVINEKAIHANSLLNSLVEYSKINHPEYTLSPERVNINELVRSYIISIYEKINDKGFNIDVDIEESPLYITLDRQLFLRMLDNIIENSLKYNPAGTDLFFKIDNCDKKALLYIGDNGVGIDPEIKEHIFEPFITSNKARSEGLGSGLGLSIVKKIVALHGWGIKLTENKKYKTLFVIEITKE